MRRQTRLIVDANLYFKRLLVPSKERRKPRRLETAVPGEFLPGERFINAPRLSLSLSLFPFAPDNAIFESYRKRLVAEELVIIS